MIEFVASRAGEGLSPPKYLKVPRAMTVVEFRNSVSVSFKKTSAKIGDRIVVGGAD